MKGKTMAVNLKSNSSMGNSGRSSSEDHESTEHVEASELAMMSEFKAREEEIMRKRMEVKLRVESQLGRAEDEAKRLGRICEELEDLGDPTRKEVATVRKKIDTANRVAQSCQKKEKEFKEAVEAFNDKSKEKAQLVAALMELLAESEKQRRKKLEELGSLVSSIR